MKQPRVLFLLVTIIILALLAAAAEAQNQLATPQVPQGDVPLPIAQNLEVVKHWGGEVSAFALHGSYGFLGVGTELQVLSLADPAAPVLVRSLILDTGINYLYVSGHYLYVAEYGLLLTIMDISDPTSPLWVGSTDVPSVINSLTVSQNYAFLAMHSGLAIVDLSVPSDPQPVYFGYDNYDLRKVIVIDHYAYFTGPDQLLVLDVASPAEPVEVFFQEVSGGSLALIGDYLYVMAYNGPTLILNVTDPAAPQEAGTINYSGYDAQVLEGDYLYLFTSPRLTLLNVANPLKPIWLGQYNFTEWIHLFQAQNGYIYTIQEHDSQWWLVTFDATTPQNPVEVSNHLVNSNPLGRGKVIVDGYLYAGTEYGVGIYDLSDPLSPLFLGSYVHGDSPRSWEWAFAVQDNFVYYVYRYCQPICYYPFLVVDVSNPQTPTLASWSETITPSRIKISGQYAFIEDGWETVFAIYDITDPTNPVLLHIFPDAIDIVSVGDYLYITAPNNPGGTLEVVDFSNPAEPAIVGSYQTPHLLTSVNVVNSYLYVIESGYRETLHVLDISNPASPIEVSTYRPPWYLATYLNGQPLIEGNYAYLGNNLFDISDPANPIQVGFHPPLPGSWAAQGDYVYVIDYDYIYYTVGSHVLKKTPVMVSLMPGIASSMTYTYYQHYPTRFDFPAAAVTEPITIAVNPSTAEDINGYSFARHTFGLSALQGDVQLPTFIFAAPVTVSLRYSHDDVGVISNEAELALWVQTENGWQDATLTCEEPAPYIRDLINNILALTICQTGRFALFGPTHQRYLPFIDQY
jgi:hypothetical protein